MGRGSATVARLGLVVVSAALAFDCVALAVDIVAGRRIVDGVPMEDVGLEIRSSLSSLANLAVPAAMMVGGSAFVWWFYDAYRRKRESGPRVGSGRHPIWALIGWVLPAVNLVMPPQLMAELAVPATEAAPANLWQSDPERDPSLQRVVFWWLLLVGGIAVQIGLRVITPQTQRGWIAWQSTALMTDLALLASLGLAALLVNDVERGLAPLTFRAWAS
jgi:hypothetical protein